MLKSMTVTNTVALLEAAQAGDAVLVRSLLNQGADPNERAGTGKFDDPPLAYAVRSGSLDCARALIEAGADVNAELGYQCIAARSPEVTMLRLLLNAGADPNWSDEHTTLSETLAREPVDISNAAAMLRELRTRGADIDNGRGFPNLWSAAQAGDADAVEALLTAGADPHIQPNPLGGAVWGIGHTESGQETARTIDLLVAAGCDPFVTDENGLTLMHGALMPYSHGSGFASSDGINLEAVRALRRHGLSLDITFPDGKRPLHVAANKPDPEAVAELLEMGVNPDDRTPTGQTALDLATARKAEFEMWAEERNGAEPGSDDERFREALLNAMIPDADRTIALLVRTT
jgi:ankyrin repeat protein